MYLKLMSQEDLADGDSRKSFQLFSNVAKVEFTRTTAGPVAGATFLDGTTERFYLKGKAYVLNNDGRTIESFAFSPGRVA